MKILLTNHFPLQGSGSGVYTTNIARILTKLGHEVMFIIPGHTPIKKDYFQTRSIIFNNGKNRDYQLDFNFPCFTTHPQSNKTTFYDLTDQQIEAYHYAWETEIDKAVHDFRPDIIHTQHIWIAPYCASKIGLPYIITCHGTDLMGIKRDKRYHKFALPAAKHAQYVIALFHVI